MTADMPSAVVALTSAPAASSWDTAESCPEPAAQSNGVPAGDDESTGAPCCSNQWTTSRFPVKQARRKAEILASIRLVLVSAAHAPMLMYSVSRLLAQLEDQTVLPIKWHTPLEHSGL